MLIIFAFLFGSSLEGEFARIGRLDYNARTDGGEAGLEDFDVFVAQADAAFAVATRDREAVARAAMDADALVVAATLVAIALGEVQTHEPGTIGGEGAAAVLEIVGPRGGVANLRDGGGALQAAFGSAHIACARLGTRFFGVANGEMGCQNRILILYLIDVEAKLLFGDDEEAMIWVGIVAIDFCNIVDVGHFVNLVASFGLLLLHGNRVGDHFALGGRGLGHEDVASEQCC